MSVCPLLEGVAAGLVGHFVLGSCGERENLDGVSFLSENFALESGLS